MDGPRVCHTELSKSEKDKQISYINTYMWNLNLEYRQTYLQGRQRDEDVENRDEDTEQEREVGTNGCIRIRTDLRALPCVKKIVSWNLLNSTGNSALYSVMT